MRNILCRLGIHKYKLQDIFSTRCDNCENIAIICFPDNIKKYKCERCGKIKYKDNVCQICGSLYKEL